MIKNTPELQKTLRMLAAINDELSLVALLKATNLETEKANWIAARLADKPYDPHFEYDLHTLMHAAHCADELSVIRDRLKEYLEPNDDCDAFIRDAALEAVGKLLDVTSIANSIAAHDDQATMWRIEKYLGEINPKLFEQAHAIADGDNSIFAPITDGLSCALSETEIEKVTKVMRNPGELVEMFAGALTEYGLDEDGWTVRCGTQYQNITVKMGCDESFVYVPSTRKPVSIREAFALLSHEVETHARDNANVAHLLADHLGAPKPLARFIAANRNSILTEGKAKINDSIISVLCTGKIIGTPLPWYLIAIEAALTGASFAETSGMLFQRFLDKGNTPEKAAENAWKFTSRVYRGCCNTRNPAHYAYYGDKCYLEGFTQALEVTAVHPSAKDYGKLYPNDFVRIENILHTPLEKIPAKFQKKDLARHMVMAFE